MRAAASLDEAIAEGVELQPDLLVADGSSRSPRTGLQAALSLRTLFPELRVLLLAESGSSPAAVGGFLELLEAPFDATRLACAIERLADGARDFGGLPVGLAILGPDRTILHANEMAQRHFAATFAGLHTTSFDALIPPEHQIGLERSTDRWHRVFPEAAAPIHWYVRRRHWPQRERSLLAILSEDQRTLMDHPLVEMLFQGCRTQRTSQLVLVADAHASSPEMFEASLDAFGGSLRWATQAAEVLRQFEREPGIRRVVLDWETVEARGEELAMTLRALRPGTRLVGTSIHDRRDEFRSLGITEYLSKPWRLFDVLELLGASPDAPPRALEAER